jgi:phage terminase small subunit
VPTLSNARREAFALAVASGSSLIEAYEGAGYTPNRGAAARLYANVSVARRVLELQEAASVHAVWTIDKLVGELSAAAKSARDRGNGVAAVAAYVGIAKLLGLMRRC